MRDPVLAAAVCGCAVVVWRLTWRAVERLRGHALVIPGLDAGLTRLLATPPLLWATAAGGLAVAHVDRPWLAPLLGGLTVAALDASTSRLLGLASMAVRVPVSRTVVVLLTGSAAWWQGMSNPGQSWPLRLAVPLLVVTLALVEKTCGVQLDRALTRREMVATGLRPWVVDDPAWTLDYVYVSPDGRSISVGYENASRDNSLSVEVVHATDDGGGSPAAGRHRAEPQLPRYVARVSDVQEVRMELDHGDAHDPEIARLASRLRPEDPAVLARCDLAGLA